MFEQGAYADRALAAEASAAALSPRDRALAMRLSYGVVQRRATLDHLASKLSERPVEKLDPGVIAALRLGLFQLLFLDGIAAHAAVNESVELVRATGSGGGGLVNAVLRRAVREGDRLLAELEDGTPTQAALRYSAPEWLAEQWWRELGPDQARALLARVNEPAESALRVNTLTSTPEEVVARLSIPVRQVPGLPEGLVLEAPFDVQSSDLWATGAVMAQSRGSMLVSRVLAPVPGDRVLDLCAAPGAKTTHVSALMGAEGEVTAVERRPARARALAATCARMHADCVQVRVADASAPVPAGPFHRVLVDPPCSGLGTLQSRPDIRWRASPESIVQFASLQKRILTAAGDATAPGGVLVYSVCTISRAESQDMIEEFLSEREDFALEQVDLPPDFTGSYVQLLPNRDGTDGFFIARLRRS